MFSFFRKPANPGLIWLDERTARRRITADAHAGTISADEEAQLTKFSRDGYFIIELDLSPSDAAAIDDDVNRLWNERPPNIAFAYDSPPKRFSSAEPLQDRKPRYRIHELHA